MLCVSFSFAQVHEIPLNRKSNVQKSITKSKSGIHFSFSQDKILSKTRAAKGGLSFTDIWLNGSYPNGEVGTPNIPAYKKLIRIPKGSKPSINIVSHTEQLINLKEKGINLPLYPNQPSVSKNQDSSKIRFEIIKEVYSKNVFSNTPIATIEVLGNLRSATIARLVVNPIDYNPGDGLLKVYNDIDVDVSFGSTLSPDEEELFDAKTYSPYFDITYKSLEQPAKSSYTEHPDLTKYPVKMLIISNRMFEQSLQPFIQWKKSKGFNVKTVYTDDIGSSATQIKTFIQQEYNSATPESPAPSFLVIVGDVAQVEASATGSATGKLTDLYYASVDGDMFPDMYYGRLSATSAEQLKNIIDKILYYEKYLFADPTYLNNVTLIAGADGEWNPNVGQPTIKYGTANYFNQGNGFSTVNEYGVTADPNNLTANSSYSGCYNANQIAVGLINYTAHCGITDWSNPSLTNASISGFTNLNKYPLAIGNCCLSGDFGSSECIGETWIRAQDKGAVTYIGSSPETYWFEDFYWSVGAFNLGGNNNGYVPTFQETTTGMYDAPFISNYVTTGGMVFAGNLAVTEVDVQHFAQQSSPTYYWEAYNVLGDPSLIPYFTEAEVNQVSYSPTIIVGESSFSVHALANSYIAISKDNQLIGTAFVTNTGEVNVPISPISTTGDVALVITRPQTIPIIDNITAISPTGPFLLLGSFTIDDHLSNNNGKADYNETFNVNLKVKNIGINDATNVSVKIIGTDAFASIQSFDSINISDISHIIGVNIINVDAAFTFETAEVIPDQHIATFTLKFYSDQGRWTSNIKILLNSPILVLGDLIIDDSQAGGNNNHLLNPGESSKLLVQLKNVGHAQAKDISFQLTIPDIFKTDISIKSIQTEPFSLEGGSFTSLPFRISVNPSIQQDIILPFTLQTTVLMPSNLSEVYEKNLTVYANNNFNQSDDTLISCFTHFYDSGGKNESYKNNETTTSNFIASGESSLLKVVFSEFSTESNYDFLYIYDGPNTNSPQVLGSPFSGSSIPNEIISTSRYLTFKFHSDGNNIAMGWAATIECVESQTPNCVSLPSPSDGTPKVQSGTLSWTPQNYATSYKVLIGPSSTNLAFSGRVNRPEFTFKPENNKTYYWKVIPENYLGINSTCSTIWHFTTDTVYKEIVMSTNTIVVDTLLFYDSGGPFNKYLDNENYTLTFKPKYPGNSINIQFLTFDTENGYDKLSIYNGLSLNSPLIGTYSGTTLPGSKQASNPDGALTFVFKSDGNTFATGWKALVKSVGVATFKTITLKVQNNSTPIADASINIGGIIRTTDINGFVTFSVFSGDIDLTVNAVGYSQKKKIVPEAETNSTIIIDLERFSTINIHVSDKKFLNDIVGVKVLNQSDSTFTNSLGVSALHLIPGTYTLFLNLKGYLPYSQPLIVDENDANIELSLTKVKYRVNFLISDALGNKIEDALVSINDTTLKTNSEGLAFGFFYKGNYPISISKSQFFDQSSWIFVDDTSTMKLNLDEISFLYNIEFTFIAKGPKSQFPLNYHDVDLYCNSIIYSRFNTDAQGKGHISLLKGNFSYSIIREGYISISNKPFLVDGIKNSIQDTIYQKTFTIQFNVSSHSASIQDASITLEGYSPEITNSAGQALFTDIGYEKNLRYIIQRDGFTDAIGYINAIIPLVVDINLLSTGTPAITSGRLNIFPNPTSDHISIESDQPITRISVVNTLGTVLLNNSYSYLNLASISMGNLAPGVYILIIYHESSVPEKALVIKR